MANVMNIKALEQLAQFANKDGIIELAIRGQNKKFSAFQKIAIDNIVGDKNKAAVAGAVQKIAQNKALAEKGLFLLGNVQKLQYFGLMLSSLNLCATCVGFAIMYKKLDKLGGSLNKLMNEVKQDQEINTNFEFNKVIAEHRNMLDCRKTQKYYTEEQMRKLVDDEYNVLKMLIEVFLKDRVTDKENLIFSIYSLASMLAVSIRYFDELYYFNNREAIGDGDIWHSSHDIWVSVFDTLTSEEISKKLEDHGFLELNLNTLENDVYCFSLVEQMRSIKEDVEDNQTLIRELNDEGLLSDFEEFINNSVNADIQELLSSVEGVEDTGEIEKVFIDAKKQVGLAV